MIAVLKRKWIFVTLLVTLSAYIGSYLALSLQGRFEPSAIGLNGVKWYACAPRGFVTEFQWNSNLQTVYLPLYVLDTKLWHTSDDAYSDRYPINEIPADEIGQVYRAWMD